MTSLLVIDVQNDFLPGGALAVREGDRVAPVINRIMRRFDLVVATQDWHPAHHASFAANHPGRKVSEIIDLHGLQQVLWPAHCVQGAPGAKLADELDQNPIEAIFRKGTDPDIDSYSGFFDNGRRKSTGLADYLRGRKIQDIYLAGLATDYCVNFTAQDALAEGFAVHLIEDACRGVELHPGDVAASLHHLRQKGAKVLSSAQFAPY